MIDFIEPVWLDVFKLYVLVAAMVLVPRVLAWLGRRL